MVRPRMLPKMAMANSAATSHHSRRFYGLMTGNGMNNAVND